MAANRATKHWSKDVIWKILMKNIRATLAIHISYSFKFKNQLKLE